MPEYLCKKCGIPLSCLRSVSIKNPKTGESLADALIGSEPAGYRHQLQCSQCGAFYTGWDPLYGRPSLSE